MKTGSMVEAPRHVPPSLLPTTVVGSYPQPDWLIDREALSSRLPPRVRALELWRVDPELLEQAQDDATRLAIADMEAAGSTSSPTASSAARATRTGSRPRSTGSTSTTRASRSTAPATRTRCRGWSGRSRGAIRSRCATSSSCARTRTGGSRSPCPGPFTMSQQAQDDFYGDPAELALAYAAAVNEEARDLKAAGADVIQIDEPYLQARPDAAREYAIPAIDRALAGIDGTTALHICFGYAAIVHKRPTAATRSSPSSLPATRSRSRSRRPSRGSTTACSPSSPARTSSSARSTSATAEIESPEAVAAHIRAALEFTLRRAAHDRPGLRDEVPPARDRDREAPRDGRRRRDRPRRARLGETIAELGEAGGSHRTDGCEILIPGRWCGCGDFRSASCCDPGAGSGSGSRCSASLCSWRWSCRRSRFRWIGAGRRRCWTSASPFLTDVALVFNWLGRGLGSALTLSAVAIALVARRRWLALLAFGVTEAVTTLSSTLLKILVGRPRPPDSLVHPVGSSFPSGHAAYAGATCVALVLLFTVLGSRRRLVGARGAGSARDGLEPHVPPGPLVLGRRRRILARRRSRAHHLRRSSTQVGQHPLGASVGLPAARSAGASSPSTAWTSPSKSSRRGRVLGWVDWTDRGLCALSGALSPSSRYRAASKGCAGAASLGPPA